VVVEARAGILADDQTDIRAHMMRAVALARLGRKDEAGFHREAAIGLVESIMRGGAARDFPTPWTVFRVKEEYDVLGAGGYAVDGQSLAKHEGRTFDLLDARKVRGGQTFRAYFDVTELFAEETRGLA